MPTADVVVVGAGVVGAAVAYRLAQAGARVSVFEAADRLGAGTSGRSFAWLNSNGKVPRAYHDLNVAGMRAHVALCEEFDTSSWLHAGGSLDWFATAADREAQRAKVERLRAWGYAAEFILPAHVHELEPDVDLAMVGDAPVAYYPEEGWLDPIPYVHAMLEAAQRHGAVLRLSSPVDRVHLDGGRVSGVSTREGQRHTADIVVNCTGRLADQLQVVDAPAVRTLPLAPTVGLLVVTPPVATCLRRIVRSPWVHLRPDGAGRLMLHLDEIDTQVAEDTPPVVDLPLAQELVKAAARVVPSIGTVTPEAVRVGVRSIPADGLSAVGPMPGASGYYIVVTHSGVTLSAVLAQLVANELVRGLIEPWLEPFRPGRFME